MKSILRLLISVGIVFSLAGYFPGTASAESSAVRFETLTVEDGLSQSKISGITQDGNGFIWFGTEEGLNQYDGYQFSYLKHDPEDSNSLIDNVVTSLISDRNGDLWIGTRSGLDHYEVITKKFSHYPFVNLASNGLWGTTVDAIAEDMSGNIWIGTRDGGLNFLDRSTGSFTHFLPDKDETGSTGSIQIGEIAIDNNGWVWVASLEGLFAFNPSTQEFSSLITKDTYPFSPYDSRCITVFIDQSSIVWIGTQGGGLIRYDPQAQEFTNYVNELENPPPVGSPQLDLLPNDYLNSSSSIGSNQVNQLLADDLGNMWIGTPEGLDRLDRGSDRFIHFVQNLDNPYNLSNEYITELFQDRSGVVWIGTFGSGVSYYSPSANKFRQYIEKRGGTNSLSDSAIYGITETLDGNLWIGTMSGGLNRYNRRTGFMRYYYHIPSVMDSLSSNHVSFLYTDTNGSLWVGTENAGLDRYNPSTDSFIHYKLIHENPENLEQYSISTISEDRSGNLWVGTNGYGFHRLSPESNRFDHFQLPDQRIRNSTIHTIFEDVNGQLWLGTSTGLYIYNIEAGRYKIYNQYGQNSAALPSNDVMSIAPNDDGTYWLAFLHGGIARFDPTIGILESYSEKDGLPSNTIYGILRQSNGNLWMSTSEGLSRFNHETITFRNYDKSDGLPGDEFNPGAFYISTRSEFFFGGLNGLVSFFPTDIKDNPVPPDVIIRTFKRFNQVEARDLSGGEIIDLSYRDNFISFEFVALYYSAPLKNQFAYQLVGFDQEWVYAGTRNYVSYTNLAGGEYTLRVKAANSDGVWNEEGMSVRIHVEPPFWTHWWFIGLVTLTIAGGVFSAYTIRMRTVRAQNRELEIQVAERTHEIERRRQVAESLREIIAVLNSDQSLQDSLGHIIDQTARLVMADAALIFHCHTEGCATVLASNLPGETEVSSWLVENILNGQPLVIPDIAGNNLSFLPQDIFPFPSNGSLIGMPLAVSEHVDGGLILYFQKAGPISEEDFKISQTLSEHTSLAMANARLRSQAEELAITAERNRLARDLHDAVTQTLFASTLIADVLPRIFKRNPQEGERQLNELRVLTRGALAEMRTLLVELRPAALSDAPLDELIQQLCDAFSGRMRLPIQCHTDLPQQLSSDVQLVFYRIAQEALNNIAKHSRAKRVEVQLIQRHGKVELTVKDYGVGFDTNVYSSTHFGLGIMHERAESIGARYNIWSTPGEGTEIRVEWMPKTEELG